MKDMKFKVSSPEQSERLQNCLFELGLKWGSGDTSVLFTNSLFIYAISGCILQSNELEFFEDHNSKEMDTEEFIKEHTKQDEEAKSIDKHYSFDYTLSEQDIKKGNIKIDPYFVSNTWQLGAKDNTGVIFHCLKTLARFGTKNDKVREITALYKQVKRLAELEGVELK